MALAYSTTLRNNRLDQITSAVGGSGFLRIYDGTRPATGGSATTLLAELTLNATFAPGAAAGVLTLNSITQDSSADATGTCTFVRVFKADGTTVLEDLEVGTSGCNVNLSSTSIVAGQPVSISSWSHTVPQSGT